jgi:hypothetical protein
MDTNLHVLEWMVAERLAHARAEARRLDLAAQGGRGRRGLRDALGVRLIALGEWLRREPALLPVGQP